MGYSSESLPADHDSINYSAQILPEEEGQRIDHVLGRLLPHLGLRGRRRLCSQGLVQLNARIVRESCKVRANDVVSIPKSFYDRVPPASSYNDRALHPILPCDLPHLVQQTEHLAFLYKPAGMHTEHLAGKPGSTLQGMLPILLKGYPDSRLMNRLDYATSGLITAALDEYGIHSYRRLQETGHTEKRYLALLEGKLSHRLRVDSQLDLTHRDRVYALSKHHSDPVRHTLLEPLSVIPTLSFLQALKAISPALVQYMKGSIPPYITLTGCTIFKGARHQIRAHASSLGYPLLGDKRYGSSTIPVEYPDELFFLHHASFLLPQIKISILPIWLNCMGEEANHAARIWLES